MRRPTLALLVLAAASVAAPADADAPGWAGFTCGFATTNDPTGLVEQNPNVQNGEMDCGPWTSHDIFADGTQNPSPHVGSASGITITGTIQVNQPDYGGAAAAKASCSASGTGVAYGACVISYEALPTDNIYLCTRVDMVHDGTTTFIYDEDDNAANGSQCALAISAGA